MTEEPHKPTSRWRRRFFLLLAAWIVSTVLLSFSPIRGWATFPLVVHQQDAAGEAAYVMADGPATWERLRAASDLYHWERVPRIIVLNETESAGYNFILRRSRTRVERVIDYLELYGVPRDAVSTLPVGSHSVFGSLNEARGVAEAEPELKSLVIVTSPGHTRRSLLAFRRSLPASVRLQAYSAAQPHESSETHSPIWIEYTKLLVYWFVA